MLTGGVPGFSYRAGIHRQGYLLLYSNACSVSRLIIMNYFSSGNLENIFQLLFALTYTFRIL